MGEQRLRVAALQTGPASGDLAIDLERVSGQLRSIEPRPDLIVLPELFARPFWCVGLADADYMDWAEPLDGPTLTAIASVARDLGAYIVTPFFERGDVPGEAFNSAALIGPDGGIVSGTLPGGASVRTYRKNAISDYSWDGHRNDETYYFRAGDGYPVFPTRFGPVGILICYDRWYPEAWRVLALQGAVLVCVPNASEGYVSNMFVPLVQTSAAQNVLFAVACNRGGVESFGGVDTHYYGRSCICGPRGDVLAEAAEGAPDAVVSAELDLDRIGSDRRRLWVYRDRRPELYSLISEPSATRTGGPPRPRDSQA
jgi:N-carbamoylputrescine amidase